jgi:hypothetical protein
VRDYYAQFEENVVQAIIDTRIREYEAREAAIRSGMLPANAPFTSVMPPHPLAPGVPPALPPGWVSGTPSPMPSLAMPSFLPAMPNAAGPFPFNLPPLPSGLPPPLPPGLPPLPGLPPFPGLFGGAAGAAPGGMPPFPFPPNPDQKPGGMPPFPFPPNPDQKAPFNPLPPPPQASQGLPPLMK